MSYATTDELYSYSGVATADISSTFAQRLLDMASERIEKACGTKFSETSVLNEVYDGSTEVDIFGDEKSIPYLVLTNMPLIKLTALNIGGTTVSTANVHKYADRLYLGTAAEVSSFGTNRQNVTLSYSYGIVDQDETVKELCLVYATEGLSTSPEGKNALLNASRYVSISGSDARPEQIPATLTESLKTRAVQLLSELQKAISLI